MTKARATPQQKLFVVSLLIFSVVCFCSNVFMSMQILGKDPALVRALVHFLERKDNSGGVYKDDATERTSPDAKEAAIPNPQPASGNKTFAACLLVMDDNHRLVEWLAYHYHVLPLRHLIVAVDPRSRTSPTGILNRYRKMGMYIEQWSDQDFMDARLVNNVIPDDARFQLKRDRHRARQKVFYRSCLIKAFQLSLTYVTLHDTDEYLVYNHAGGEKYEEWERRMQDKHDKSRNKRKLRVRPFHTPPSTANEGGLLRYIQAEKRAGNKYYASPCLSVPRLHFGSVESSQREQASQVPQSFAEEAGQFDTFRWRKHSKRNDFVKNNLAKVIIDVSRVNMAATARFQSLHRPIPALCQAPWVNDWETGLRINHYLGSWESFSFRNDARRGGERSREKWEFQAADQEETDDNIRPWLEGFVKSHGVHTAKSLLKGVGLPKDYQNPNNSAWEYMWLQETLRSNQTEGTNPKNHEFDTYIRRKYGINA